MGPHGRLGNPGASDRLQPPHPGTRVALPGFARALQRHHTHTCGRCAGPPSLKCQASGQGGGSRQCPGLPGPRSPTVSVLCAPPHTHTPRSRGGGGWSLASRERSSGRCCNVARLPRSIPEPRGFRGTSRDPLSDYCPHLVETVLAVGFCLHLHLHQHRVRPRHIAQHGWGRRHRRHGRFFSGVRRGCRLTAIAPSRLWEEGAAVRPPALHPTQPLLTSPPPPRQPVLGSYTAAPLRQPHCLRRYRHASFIEAPPLRRRPPPITACLPLLPSSASQ